MLADDKESVLLIDVRLGEMATIPSAKHIPVTDLEDEDWDWSKEQAIVVFCQYGRGGSEYAAEVLGEKGYRHVKKLVGGMDSWVQMLNAQ